MNTIGSVYYGWGFLILCGAGSYYMAKRSINSDKYARASQQSDINARRREQEAKSTHMKIGGGQGGGGSGGAPQSGSSATAGGGAIAQNKSAGGKDQEVGEQEGMGNVRQKLRERDQRKEQKEDKSEYESQTPFRSRKGDRFS